MPSSFTKTTLLYLVLLLCISIALPLQAKENKTAENFSGDYKIGKGDVLEINVWKEEDVSKTVKVRTDGAISLPLINDVKAAGRTPVELKKAIEQALKKYIDTPTVSVIVQSQESRKFYIIGEIKQTGEYPLQKDLNVVQAITLAGGFTEWADKDDILLLRKQKNSTKRIPLDYYNLISENKNNFQLQADDTIVIQ